VKKIAIFDIDGVIYEGHSIFDVIKDQESKGMLATGTWDKISFQINEYKSGNGTYKQIADNMLNIFATSLKGKSYQDILEHNINFFKENKTKFFPYFENLIPELSKTHDLYFVTTNFQFTAEAIATIFGVKNYLSSIAEVKDGIFTGQVQLSLGGNKGIVSDLVSRYGREGSVAVGDSENDADMLEKVELPVVIEPNEKMLNIAKEKGWQIVNRDTITDIIINYAK
jgi:phosphoserine phosphatase